MRRRRVGFGVVLCLLGAACAGPSLNPALLASADTSPAPTSTVVEAAMPEVAVVGEVEIGVDEFLAECLHEDSALMRQVIERVVLGRLVLLEAERLGVLLSDERLMLEQAAALAKVAEQVEESTPGLGLDTWITSRLGLDPGEFKSRIRARVERELLAQRVVRLWFLGQDRAEVRILLSVDLATAQGALERYAGGEDFAALARELSVDRSAEDGGRTAPVIRGETLLGTIAFESGVGEVAGPFEQQGRWLLVEVVTRHKGTGVAWSETREQVEASLEDRSVEDAEFWQWKERMQSVYSVDITPLFRLAGEPGL